MPRVLIVDDNEKNLRLLNVMLSSQGYEVQHAQGGAEALRLLENELPALVLCDVQMPGIDGLELARRLRYEPRTRDLRLVAITALAMKGDREAALEAGYDAYLAKPYALKELLVIVREQLSQQRA